MGIVRLGAASVLVGALALSAAPCSAGKATYTMPVQVNVTNACTVSAVPLIFTIAVPANADVDRTTTITVQCPPNIPYTIDIDEGLWPQGGSGAKRRVKHQTINDYMTYDVYKDPPRSQVWGKGNLKQVNGNSGLSGTVIYTVFGRLNGKTTMRAGRYSDLLTVTVNY